MSETSPERSRMHAAHWQAALRVLEQVGAGAQPADTALQAWFRDHRQMGGRDRANVTGLVYGVLRDAMRLRHIAGEQATMTLLLCVHALASGRLDITALRALAGPSADEAQARLAGFDEAALSEAERNNVPSDLWLRWRAQYGEDAVALAQALNHEAPVDLRVNLLKATRAQVTAALAESGLESRPSALSPWGLRLSRRAALQTTPAWRDGWIEPQDEGSQLLALLVDAQPGERVADFCAGAGGKTLALGAAMANQGTLWALDIAVSRLSRLGARAQRAGLDIVQACALPDVDWLAAQRGSFDAVLVDAPCSATGTWRRNPELRLRAVDFAGLAQQQRAILADAASLVSPGGRLIYATCSLMSEENEAVVRDFLATAAGFDLDPPGPAFGSGRDGDFLRLLPHRHGTDGFFAARLLRRNET